MSQPIGSHLRFRCQAIIGSRTSQFTFLGVAIWNRKTTNFSFRSVLQMYGSPVPSPSRHACIERSPSFLWIKFWKFWIFKRCFVVAVLHCTDSSRGWITRLTDGATQRPERSLLSRVFGSHYFFFYVLSPWRRVHHFALDLTLSTKAAETHHHLPPPPPTSLQRCPFVSRLGP